MKTMLVKLAVEPWTRMIATVSDEDMWECQWVTKEGVPQTTKYPRSSLVPLPETLTAIQLIAEINKLDAFHGVVIAENPNEYDRFHNPLVVANTSIPPDTIRAMLRNAIQHSSKLFPEAH